MALPEANGNLWHPARGQVAQCLHTLCWDSQLPDTAQDQACLWQDQHPLFSTAAQIVFVWVLIAKRM